jgi:uncharacterized protein YcfL
MKKLVLFGTFLAVGCLGLVGCAASEPAPTEGDAAIVKETPKNTSAVGKSSGGSNATPQVMEPPPPDGN